MLSATVSAMKQIPIYSFLQYLPSEVGPPWLHIPASSTFYKLSLTPLKKQGVLETINFELLLNLKCEGTVFFIMLLNNTAIGKLQI